MHDSSPDIMVAVKMVVDEVSLIQDARAQFAGELAVLHKRAEEAAGHLESLLQVESGTIAGRIEGHVSEYLRVQKAATQKATNDYLRQVKALAERVESVNAELTHTSQESAEDIRRQITDCREALHAARSQYETETRTRDAETANFLQQVKVAVDRYQAEAQAIHQGVAHQAEAFEKRLDDRLSESETEYHRRMTDHLNLLKDEIRTTDSELRKSQDDLESLIAAHKKATVTAFNQANERLEGYRSAADSLRQQVDQEVKQVAANCEHRLREFVTAAQSEYTRRMTDRISDLEGKAHQEELRVQDEFTRMVGEASASINQKIADGSAAIQDTQARYEALLRFQEDKRAVSLARYMDRAKQCEIDVLNLHEKVKHSVDETEKRLADTVAQAEFEYHRRMTAVVDRCKELVKEKELQIQADMTRLTEEAAANKERMRTLEEALVSSRQDVAELRELIAKKRGFFW